MVEDQQAQATSDMGATGDDLPEVEPVELGGAIGQKVRALLSQRQAVAVGQYVGMVRRLAKGETLADDELLALADAARTLRYDSSQIDSDVDVVKRYAQLQSVAKEHGALVKEVATATAGVERHYQKVLSVVAEQKKLADALDILKGRRDWLASRLSDGEKLKAQNPDLLGQ